MRGSVYLYVPLSNPQFVAKAASRGADVVILDLEDGVPEDAKDMAREALTAAVRDLHGQGQAVAVRVNANWGYLWRDVEACVTAGVKTIILPKAQDSHQVLVLAEYLGELEARHEPRQATSVILLIETPKGIENVQALLTVSKRVTAVIPGNEDLARSYGVVPTLETMLLIQQPLIRSAHAHGLRLIGSIGSIAEYKDLDTYRRQVEAARAWGFQGATCIHPSQSPVVQQVYAGTADAAWAQRVIKAFEASGGAPTEVDGRMVDRPVYLRAQRILQAHPPCENED